MNITYQYSRPGYHTGYIDGIEKLSSTLYMIRICLINDSIYSLPPQFVMIWVPGYEAIPMSIAEQSGDGSRINIIVKPVGETTRALVQMDNEYIGLIGPLGTPLTPSADKILLIAGGSGIAPLIRYAQYYASLGKKLTLVLGAWSYREIGETLRLTKKYVDKVITACMDKCEAHGLVTDVLSKGYVDENEYDYVIAAGPEAMLKNLAKLIKRPNKTIFIMERHVKCGLGLCGSCIIRGTNKLLCYHGPGFLLSEVEKVIRN